MLPSVDPLTSSCRQPCLEEPPCPLPTPSSLGQMIKQWLWPVSTGHADPRVPAGWCLLCLQKKAILTTIGVLEEPLGNARLHGARLMAALLYTNTPSINQELCRLNTMDLLLVSGHLSQPCVSACAMHERYTDVSGKTTARSIGAPEERSAAQ